MISYLELFECTWGGLSLPWLNYVNGNKLKSNYLQHYIGSLICVLN